MKMDRDKWENCQNTYDCKFYDKLSLSETQPKKRKKRKETRESAELFTNVAAGIIIIERASIGQVRERSDAKHVHCRRKLP